MYGSMHMCFTNCLIFVCDENIYMQNQTYRIMLLMCIHYIFTRMLFFLHQSVLGLLHEIMAVTHIVCYLQSRKATAHPEANATLHFSP